MVLNGEMNFILKSQAAVKGRFWVLNNVKDDCTSRLCGSGLGSPLGETLSGGASRVLSKSSAKIERQINVNNLKKTYILNNNAVSTPGLRVLSASPSIMVSL